MHTPALKQTKTKQTPPDEPNVQLRLRTMVSSRMCYVFMHTHCAQEVGFCSVDLGWGLRM